MYQFGHVSLERLNTCDDRLRQVMEEAIRTAPFDFTILCGHRTREEQDRCCAAGTSKTPWPTSKHNSLPSLAVDIAPIVAGNVAWRDPDRFRDLADHVLTTADRLGVSLRWGGDWDGDPSTPNKFNDYPHFEIKGP